MKEQYIGITFGPIFATFDLVKKPSALWAASFLFSAASKLFCKELVDNYGVNESDIISPFYSREAEYSEYIEQKRGFGLFSDHIIFRKKDFDYSKIAEVRKSVINSLSELFGLEKEYLDEYIFIGSVCFEAAEGENPILASAKMLDSVELAQNFVSCSDKNPILDRFNGKKDDSISSTPVLQGIEKWQLRDKDGSLLTLAEIAQGRGNGQKKRGLYYAIVRADGDGMSKFIQASSDDLRTFSKNCMLYCNAMANLVEKYGGATIYAGGDDLLAILPCATEVEIDKNVIDIVTVLNFAKEARELFNMHFDKGDNPFDLSLSLGITIAYNKFPLYEALENSGKMLFDIAKHRYKKNGIAIHVQKHAGQSEGLYIKGDAIDAVLKLQDEVLKRNLVNSEMVLSVLHKISLFSDMFNNAYDDVTIENLFDNLFDGEGNSENEFIHKNLMKFFSDLAAEKDIKTDHDSSDITPEIVDKLMPQTVIEPGNVIHAIDDSGVHEPKVLAKGEYNPAPADRALTMHYVLRILKFFIEEKGEK